ncbi:MAG: OadG family protein [Spirochaetales bacterium]|nr:OadG family protein [Spirochaetales bacterium]
MSIESFGFVLVVALFGMLIVFGLLALLSVLMSALRGVDRVMPTRSGDGKPPAKRDAQRAAGTGTQDWVIAAAFAYMLLEEEDARPKASPWTAGRSFRGDPWPATDFGDQT